MRNNNKLFLIDGMALIYRAYYAMIRNPLTSSKGLNTSAIYGFINSLMKIIKDEKPQFMGVVLDTKAKTFRHVEYSEYKANRKPMPDDLSEQIEPLLNILNAMNIKIYKKDGFEADDIIGTIAREATKSKIYETYMYSGDKDLMQLINRKTFLYSPGNTFKPTKIYGNSDVKDKYGIEKEYFIDYLALLGDTSDNIPGVKGVGAKTSSKLISKYNTIEKIYNSINNIENPRLKKLLEENKESAILSKNLVTIDCDVNIDFTISEMTIENINMSNMVVELNKLDIHAFDSFNDKIQLSTQKVKKSYKVINSESDLDLFFNEIKAKDVVSIDLETTSVDANIAEIVGVSFSFNKDEAFYLPFIYPEKKPNCLQKEFLLKKLKLIIESFNLKFIGQNIKYDALVLKKYNINLDNIYFDTMIAESIIAPEQNIYNLDYLSDKYLHYSMISIDELIGDNTEFELMGDVPLEKISYYACEDADIAFQIFLLQKPLIEENNLSKLFYDIEIPFINVLVELEYNGVYVDENIIKNLSVKLKAKLEDVSNEIYKLADKKFNINSPKQLAVVLFDELNLKMFKKRSTSVEVLKKLLDFHPIAEYILEYRHLSKLINTYLDKLPNYINEKTGRIHTSFNQAITSTGRLSSTKPNFQNIPIKTDMGKSIRKAFSVQNSNHIILSFDYSQIELRILAHYSKEDKLIKAFENKLDVHKRTAALIYGLSDYEVGYDHRRIAKMINYSIAYGAGPFRISEELKIPIKEAKVIIENYFERYPGIKRYIDETIEIGKKQGYVETFFGRKRNTANLNSSNKNIREAEKRASINMPIQGTASELIKIAMIRIREKMGKNKCKAKMILQVHDELLFELPKEEKDYIEKIVIDSMVNAIKFTVPIVVDSNFGNNWYEAH